MTFTLVVSKYIILTYIYFIYKVSNDNNSYMSVHFFPLWRSISSQRSINFPVNCLGILIINPTCAVVIKPEEAIHRYVYDLQLLNFTAKVKNIIKVNSHNTASQDLFFSAAPTVLVESRMKRGSRQLCTVSDLCVNTAVCLLQLLPANSARAMRASNRPRVHARTHAHAHTYVSPPRAPRRSRSQVLIRLARPRRPRARVYSPSNFRRDPVLRIKADTFALLQLLTEEKTPGDQTLTLFSFSARWEVLWNYGSKSVQHLHQLWLVRRSSFRQGEETWQQHTG